MSLPLQVNSITITSPTSDTIVNVGDSVTLTWTCSVSGEGPLNTEQVYEVGFDDPEVPDQFVGLSYPVTTGSVPIDTETLDMPIPLNIKSSDQYYIIVECKNLSPLATAPISAVALSPKFTIINPADPTLGDPGFTDE